MKAADRTFDPQSFVEDPGIPKMTIAEAIKLLQLADRKSVRAARNETTGHGWIRDPDWGTPEEEEQRTTELREGIMEKLNRLHQRTERERLEQGWTKHGDVMVPPGFGPLADCKALPSVGEGAEAESEPSGPSIRQL